MTFSFPTSASPSPLTKKNRNKSLKKERRYRSFFYACRCALARAGEPPARVPHAETVHRTVSPPLLRFCKERDFAPCAERPKTLSLDFAAFEKAGETLYAGRQFSNPFLFRPTERFILVGAGLCAPARLQQSRFRAMKEKSKIELPARFTARWHAPRIRCAG